MFKHKSVYLLSLLFTVNVFSTVTYDVTCLLSLGKNSLEINKNLKELSLKKVTLNRVLNEHFDAQEKAIAQKIRSTFGISALTWKTMEDKYHAIINKDPLYDPASSSMTFSSTGHPIIKKAQELIKAYGMNPSAITITNSSYCSPACVSTTFSSGNPIHTLYLDIPYLQTLSSQEYTAIIKHELMHLWYADPMRLILLFPLIPCLNPDNEPLIGDYRKNFEMRADIMGTYHDTADIHGLASWFSKYTCFDSVDCHSHPTHAQRLAALKALLSYKSEAVKYGV